MKAARASIPAQAAHARGKAILLPIFWYRPACGKPQAAAIQVLSLHAQDIGKSEKLERAMRFELTTLTLAR